MSGYNLKYNTISCCTFAVFRNTIFHNMNDKPLRIVFMGTPDFAVPSLDILIKNGYNVVGVVTSTDSYGGRGGKQLLESKVKKYAVENHIPILQPEKLKSKDFINALKAWQADLQIVVAFRMLPEIVWNMPPQGTYNLHGSLLPKYRGAAPINHAIIAGDKITGVTSFKLQHAIDTGDIFLQKTIEIHEDDNAGTLHDKMMILGAEVILATVDAVTKGKVFLNKQEETEASHAPKIFHETCQIVLSHQAQRVHNFIRGLSPYPGAWLVIDDMEIKILKSEVAFDTHSGIGQIKTDNKKFLHVGCCDHDIKILELKAPGKKAMRINEFLNGYIIRNPTVAYKNSH